MSRTITLELDSRIHRNEFTPSAVSTRSLVGLHAASFFLAELTGVVVPFFNDYLKSAGWRYDAIGAATALAGAGAMLMQTPTGALLDRVSCHRAILAGASLGVGVCYGLLPTVPAQWWTIITLLVLAGMAKAFFKPSLGALAIRLVPHQQLNRTIGLNECCNHLGNIVAAASAMLLVSLYGISLVFFAVLVVSLLAAASISLIRRDDLLESRAPSHFDDHALPSRYARWTALLQSQPVVVLLAAATLFHFANAPAMPLVALYVKDLHGSDWQVAAVVLVAQTVMVPVAVLTGHLCDRWGRKPALAIGFLVLPVRIMLYSLASSPGALVAMQALDGVGAGVFGVAVVAICADLGRDKGRFNTLAGLVATAGGLGGVLGTLLGGSLVQHLGFAPAFEILAGIAALAAALFVAFMPETRRPIDAAH